MNAVDLLAHLRRRTRPTYTPAQDHVAVDTSPPKPDESPRPTPTPPKSPQRSQRLPPGQAWPSPRTWLTAELTAADEIREERVIADLARLTDQLGSPLAAAQHAFARDLREDRT